MAKYLRILSMDGGGLRGIASGTVAALFESILRKKTGKPEARIGEFFDLIAGTSTGGILASLYRCPGSNGKPKYDATQAVSLYLEHGADIFRASLGQRIKSGGGVFDEKYSADALEAGLKEFMGDTMLADMAGPMLVVSYDIEARKGVFFKQHKAVGNPERNFRICDVARATSAAPTYFECARITAQDGKAHTLIDGGLIANNPAMCAYAEGRHMQSPSGQGKATARDMVMLSLTTGTPKTPYPYEKARNFGLAEWVGPILDIVFNGPVSLVDYQLREIFASVGCPNQYLRVEDEVPDTISAALDDADPDNMRALQAWGNDMFQAEKQRLEALADLVLEGHEDH